MLEIYPFILETISIVRPLSERIYREDSDLGRQLAASAGDQVNDQA